MRVKNLKLNNFRVYRESNLSFHGDLIFFIGTNGSGKTSLLEAIHHLAILRSFRKGKDADLISWHNSFYAVQALVENQHNEVLLHAGYGSAENTSQSKKLQRSLLVNKNRVKRMSDFVGKLQLVVFTPDDMDFVDTVVSERRRFFDMLLSALFPSYLDSLQSYKKILEQRSHLLKNSAKANPLYFQAVDKELAKAGVEIMQRRKNFFEKFKAPFARYIEMVSDGQDHWHLVYKPSLDLPSLDVPLYQKILSENLQKDLRNRQTNLGIHRDKIFFQHPETKKDVQLAASQGQKRTVALALRMAQFDLTKDISQETPVVLIDDVLNELDIHRRSRFISFLREIGQAFITTTDLNGMEDFIAEQKKKMSVEIFQVQKDGNISLVE